MQLSQKRDHRTIYLGCAVLALIALMALLGLMALVLRQERRSAKYPGSVQISSHSNYKALPREFRWDDSYRTGDSFPQVYNWYSRSFGLGPERRANGTCILMEGNRERLSVQRYMGVMVCDTPNGRMIFVSRSITLR